MSSRVDFAFGAPDRLRAACQVVRKHYVAGRKLIIYHSEPKFLADFDDLLWGFDPSAFVPHVMAEHPHADHTPILLYSQNPQPHSAAQAPYWLLNLDPQCPPLPSPFARILEIVSEDETDKQAARSRWRQYKQHHCAVHAHQLPPYDSPNYT